MADANQELFDASLRHQIGIRRFTAGEIKQMMIILEASDAELVALLRKRLGPLAEKPLNIRDARYQALLKDVRELRRQMHLRLRELLRNDLKTLAKLEQQFELRIFNNSLPVQLELATASASQLSAIVTAKPFSGGANAARTLQNWFTGLAASDSRRLQDAINLGLAQQESIDQIVRRVAGTRANQFRDGALAVTRRNAEAIVRTAANHVSNQAREALWEENADIIRALKWNATLDGRTSPICQARDGHFANNPGHKPLEPKLVPQTARPPAHPNCRSVMIAILDTQGVADQMGERPFVRDTRTRRMREKDFRAEAKAQVGKERWSQMTRQQRNAMIRDNRNAWAEANIGQVPADVNYDTWLRRQPTDFQNEVLGPTRAKAFRKGAPLDKFVDRAGNELTLEELEKMLPDFF